MIHSFFNLQLLTCNYLACIGHEVLCVVGMGSCGEQALCGGTVEPEF